MSLTITISDGDAEYFERYAGTTMQPRCSSVGVAVAYARESIARGEVKITLDKGEADYMEIWEYPDSAARYSSKVKAFRAELQTPYERWHAALSPDARRAFDCAVATYKALRRSGMHHSAGSMRDLITSQFSPVALEALA